ncbi:hypothetical protein CVIRNUC_009412 [Coccomyxa viridis]|uniref:Cell cycle checkpoint protein RAD17 n=1 Tax=Coccomyxa viridis TaxID=1274662 RepID=A0AAV1IJS6_9CHLO|nr:hypothetical protein CVIRNUC_009412 [Coccomyxa viridis]
MPPKRKHDVWIISSEDDDEKPPAKKGTQRISNKMAITKPSPRKQRQGQLPFRSSQEERKGGLSLSLSQPADSKAAPRGQNQSTLQFKPITQAEATALDIAEVVGTTDTHGVGRGFQGSGPHLQEPRLQEHAASQAGWLAKHAPETADSLAMHAKKVQEIRGWLELQRQPGLQCPAPRMLLLSGPAGCGKSAVLQVLAKELGFVPCEWQPPVPTLWHEHRYQSDGGSAYSSKLDDFEAFVARSKLAALQLQPSNPQPPSQQTQASQSQPGTQVQRKLTVVDDVPHAGDPVQRRRLTELLVQLARSSRFPVALIVTGSHAPSGDASRSGGSSRGASFQGWHRDIQTALEASGVAHISCNPITANNAAKALLRAAEAEQMPLSKEQAQSIAEAASGDLRNAMKMLQLLALGHSPAEAVSRPRKKRNKKAKLGGAGMRIPDLDVERDTRLDSFHAIGKLLYNKRDASSSQAQQSPQAEEIPLPWRLNGERSSQAGHVEPEPLQLAPRYQRPPLPFDPEAVWQQSDLDLGTTAGFLHENCLHFLEDSAIQDAALESEFFSDADRMSSRGYASSAAYLDADLGPASSALQAAAASLLLRGLLFAAVEQAPRRWLPLRKSAWGTAQQGVAANLAQLRGLVWARTGSA